MHVCACLCVNIYVHVYIYKFTHTQTSRVVSWRGRRVGRRDVIQSLSNILCGASNPSSNCQYLSKKFTNNPNYCLTFINWLIRNHH